MDAISGFPNSVQAAGVVDPESRTEGLVLGFDLGLDPAIGARGFGPDVGAFCDVVTPITCSSAASEIGPKNPSGPHFALPVESENLALFETIIISF
jgi:hypothetical protein